MGVAASIGGAQVVVVILVGLQLPDDALPGNAYAGHVVGAAFHLRFYRVEGVLGVKHRHVPGAVRDGDGSVCLSWFFRFLRLALYGAFRREFTREFVSRNRKRQRAEAQHHCQ